MMNLVGERVRHMRFGDGVITGFDGRAVEIAFDGGDAHAFPWPAAFGSFLTAESADVMAEAEKARQAQRVEAKERLVRLEQNIAALKPEPASKKKPAQKPAAKKTTSKPTAKAQAE